MTIKVNISVSREFVVNGNIEDVYLLLSDVPASAAHFPKVHALTELAADTYEWQMEKVLVGMHAIQTSYACEYIADPVTKNISWTPVEDHGNALVSGQWQLTEQSGNTLVEFETDANLTLPLPALLSMAVGPLVKLEFIGLIDRYLQSIRDEWD